MGSKERYNIHHFVLETGDFPGRQVAEIGARALNGFAINFTPTNTNYSIEFGVGNGHHDVQFFQSELVDVTVPRFARKGKNQPNITAGMVDSISVSHKDYSKIVDGKLSGGELITGERATRKAISNVALVSAIHYSGEAHGYGIEYNTHESSKFLEARRVTVKANEGHLSSYTMRVFLLNLGDEIGVNYYNYGAKDETDSVVAEFGLDEQEGPNLQELDCLLAPKPKLIIREHALDLVRLS